MDYVAIQHNELSCNEKSARDGKLGYSKCDRTFFAVAMLLFVCSIAATIVLCASMSAMRGMPMPGGWTMSMAWMRMPGQSWIDAAALFVGMWIIMMVAMMLPSLMPMLSRYRRVLATTDTINKKNTATENKNNTTQLGKLTALAGAGYFFAWILLGIVIFPLGVMLAAFEMQMSALAQIVPVAVGIIVAIAGAFQFTARKAHYLTCCRETPQRSCTIPANINTAWRYGLRLGAHCIYCCANLTLVLLVVGVMDLSAMVIVTLAITVERLAPDYRKAAHAIGIVLIIAGVFLFAQAMFLRAAGFYWPTVV